MLASSRIIKLYKNRLTIILGLLVTILFSATFSPIWANMGPPPTIGDNTGLAFVQNYDIEVTSQILNIDWLDNMTFDIEAIYTMTNTSNAPLSVAAMFVSPIYRGNDLREYRVFSNDTQLDYSTRLIIFEYIDFPVSWYENLDEAIDIASTEEISWDWPGYSLVTFTINFLANETLNISFSYNYQPNLDFWRSRNPNRATLLYLLSPAKFWADYANLEINVTLFTGHIMSSTPLFERISPRNYRFISATLPQGELWINVSTMPAGFAFIQNGNVFLFVLSIALYFVIGALLIFLVVLVFVRAKQYLRPAVSSVYGVLSIVSFCLALVFLALSLNAWIAWGFSFMNVYLYILSIISFVMALIWGAIYLIYVKKVTLS